MKVCKKCHLPLTEDDTMLFKANWQKVCLCVQKNEINIRKWVKKTINDKYPDIFNEIYEEDFE